ncbi:tetratricopeptide repeat protein, partial [Candidatus Hodarchaeum mangrovi]
MLVISFFSKRFQRFKGKPRFKELQAIENLVQKGRFDEALKEMDTLETQGIIQQNMRPYVQFLKSNILFCTNDYENGLKITESLLKEGFEYDTPFFQIDILIMKANALLALGNFIECLESINIADSLLAKIEQPIKEITSKRITINYIKIQLFRKKGEFSRAHELLQDLSSIQSEFNNQTQLGVIFAAQGAYEDALQILLNEDRGKHSEVTDNYSLIRSNNNLGLLYTYTGELDQALNTLGRNSELILESGNRFMSATHDNNLRLIY